MRQAREKAQLCPEDLADLAKTSATFFTQAEEGEEDPGRFLVECADRDLNQRGALLDLWARTYIAVHAAARTAVDRFQSEARHIRDYQPLMIPEFLHTSAYARAVAEAEVGSDSESNASLRSLHYADHGPPSLCLIVDETAIRRTVGTHDITHEQLKRLHSAAQRPHVSLHIIARTTRRHPGLRAPARTLTFGRRRTIAYADHATGPGALITEPGRVQDYCDLLAALQGAALPVDDSLALLDDAIGTPKRRAITTGSGPDPLAPHYAGRTGAPAPPWSSEKSREQTSPV
ncbi:DUF5753 domain-containing protein [Murinocardiopsis flavida]|uniref:DUF5753 domain-containing protein n=1 Tax=Murinocardiopsis flavida TaxID=645275 RepID=UPI000D0CEC8D|nr:DUF5753 domain-containing protein [Murinocardiopsis flavida]